MSHNRIIVPIRPGCSDGNHLHVPKQGTLTQVIPPTLYLEKTGDQWMERRGHAQPGAKYVLDRLPDGYTMWQRPRPSDPKHIDKYLYGHPQSKLFDSPNRFYMHFEFLMNNNGSNIGCQCKLCSGGSGLLPRSTLSSAKASTDGANIAASSRPSTSKSAAAAPAPSFYKQSAAPVISAPMMNTPFASTGSLTQSKGRPKLVSAGAGSSRVDEEGTPDVYRNLIDKLKQHQVVDEAIREPLSPDWYAEQEILPGLLQSLKTTGQWVPRTGDIVLYVRELPKNLEIMRHEVTEEFQMYDEESEEMLGSPLWEAGLVAENPTESSSIADLHRGGNDRSVIYSGVRVEPLPDPNSEDKSLSKRHKHVSLRQTRPFVLWKELLHNVSQDQWHPTIINALTVMSTLSLVGKFRFRGTWPDANIFCHGLYIGSEMLAVGDTIRLLPNAFKKQTYCQEILIIKSIRLRYSNLDKASDNDYDDGRPYNSNVFIYGAGYSRDQSQLNKEYLSQDNAEPPKAAAEYGEWYPLHPTNKELVVPYTRILGRLYEREAMAFWLNAEPGHPPTLDNGREALEEARDFAHQRDRRMTQNPGTTWHWADCRAESLNLRTINGLDVSKHDQERDVRDMRKKMKVIEDMENDKPPANKSTGLASLGSRGLRSFMAPGTGDQPALTREPSSSASGTASSSTSTSSAGKKRPNIINLSDDDEDEIREHTRIVDNGTSMGGKKYKVAVVIK